jgi:hypothetical protein
MRVGVLAALLLVACAPDSGHVDPARTQQPITSCDLSVLTPDPRHQIRERLLAGAFTDVPTSANTAYTSLVDGKPLHVTSAVTGVEFHVPGKISSVAGGLSATPRPILKTSNGVSYWFFSGSSAGCSRPTWGCSS